MIRRNRRMVISLFLSAILLIIIISSGAVVHIATAQEQAVPDLETYQSSSIDGEIVSVDAAAGTYTAGDSVPIDITIRNTGSASHDFYIDAGVSAPGDSWHYAGETTAYLEPGDQATVTIYYSVTSDDPAGRYGAGANLFKSSYGDKKFDERFDWDAFGVEELKEEIDADINWADISSGTYKSGEAVPASASIENTGNVAHTFFVGYSAIGPSGEYYDNDGTTGTTVTLSPDESQIVNLQWRIEDAPSGQYDAEFAVWKESDPDNLYTNLDRETKYGVFQIEDNSAPSAEADCDSSTRVGETIECDAYGTTDPDGNIEEYEWEFGDGATAFGKSVTHTYDEPGTYYVELTVTDTEGASDSTTHQITVDPEPNEPPSAEADCPSSAQVSETIECDAYGTTDPDGNIEEYEWEFGDGATGFGESVTHTYDEPGTYYVELTVTDTEGASDSTTHQITVDPKPNEPPRAVMDCTPESLISGEQITCDASASEDDNGVTEYTWDFGDGTTRHGETVTHTYDSPGEYEIFLEVRDAEGRTDQASIQVEVRESASPSIDIRAPESIQSQNSLPVEVMLENNGAAATRSSLVVKMRGQQVHQQQIKLGPSDQVIKDIQVTPPDDIKSATVTAQYAEASAKTTVDIQSPPIARIDCPETGSLGETITFDASPSTDEGEIVEYQWEFTDEIEREGQTTTYTFEQSGLQTVKLTVVDDSGLSNTTTAQIEVARGTPTASFNYRPKDPTVNDEVQFDASSSSDSETRVQRYEWDLDNDGDIEDTGPKTIKSFSPGKHTVSLTVTDTEGLTDRKERVIDVESDRLALSITATDTELQTGDTTSIQYSAQNFLKNSEATVQLLIKSPSDVSVTGMSGVQEASNQFTAVGTVPANQQKNMRIHLRANGEGTHTVTAIAAYAFEEDSEPIRRQKSIDLSVSDESDRSQNTDDGGNVLPLGLRIQPAVTVVILLLMSSYYARRS